MRASRAHLAGVGTSETTSNITEQHAITAATKALLDAGVTFGDVNLCVAGFIDHKTRISPTCFEKFGTEGAAVSEINNGSTMALAVRAVQSGQVHCALMIALDNASSKSGSKPSTTAVSLVLVSDRFLTSRAYLKDSSVCLRACVTTSQIPKQSSKIPSAATVALRTALLEAGVETKEVKVIENISPSKFNSTDALKGLGFDSSQQTSQSPGSSSGTTGLLALCHTVWQLRGWAKDKPLADAHLCLQMTMSHDGMVTVTILARSDDRKALSWEEVQNVRDGRERLGYNPATETRGISQEDLQSVRSREEFSSRDSLKRLRLPVKGGDRTALARL